MKVINLKQNKEGVFEEEVKDKGTRCGYCPRLIFKDNEAHARISMLDEKPICAVCRVKHSKRWAEIEADKPKYVEDIKHFEENAQDEANAIVEKVAAQSILETDTALQK